MRNILFVYNNTLDGSYGGSQRTKQAIDGLNLLSTIQGGQMNSTLFVYNNPLDGSQGTKKVLSGLMENCKIIPFSCIKKANKFSTLWRNLCGYSGNLSYSDCKRIISLLKNEDIDIVYFDVSIHGCLVKKIKQKFPNKKIIVNYHNCEAQYFGDMYKKKGLLYYPIFRSAVKNELLSKKYADFHVFITTEDRLQLGVEKDYCIIPVTLNDQYTKDVSQPCTEPYLLFVGAAQFANIEGAKFIIEKIAPFIERKILIVGKGMKSAFPGKYKNIEIYDYAPSLSDIYKNASAFISPLFSGSGAKVKVAEALMYGKKIIGTPLTFFGYEMKDAEYSICETPEEYVAAINRLDMNKCFYEKNRILFLSKYDSKNNKNYYKQIFKSLGEI